MTRRLKSIRNNINTLQNYLSVRYVILWTDKLIFDVKIFYYISYIKQTNKSYIDLWR